MIIINIKSYILQALKAQKIQQLLEVSVHSLIIGLFVFVARSISLLDRELVSV